jgi:hypothetical protein
MISLASLSPQECNGMVTLAWNFLKRSNQFKLKVIKSGNWEMVMEVFQLVFNAYSSLVMMYGLWCDEKNNKNLKDFWISKIWISSFFNGVFWEFFFVLLLMSLFWGLRGFYRGWIWPSEVNKIVFGCFSMMVCLFKLQKWLWFQGEM